jgi:hypothetical protein
MPGAAAAKVSKIEADSFLGQLCRPLLFCRWSRTNKDGLPRSPHVPPGESGFFGRAHFASRKNLRDRTLGAYARVGILTILAARGACVRQGQSGPCAHPLARGLPNENGLLAPPAPSLLCLPPQAGFSLRQTAAKGPSCRRQIRVFFFLGACFHRQGQLQNAIHLRRKS